MDEETPIVMIDRTGPKIVITAVVVLVAAVVLAGLFGSSSPTTTNGAAQLGLIAGVAVGIERMLEMFWATIGQLQHAWWPLSVPAKRLNDFVAALNNKTAGFVREAQAAIDNAKSTASVAPARLAEAEKYLTELKQALGLLEAGEVPNQANALERSNTLTSADLFRSIDGVIGNLQSTEPRLVEATKSAKAVIGSLDDFVSSFKDNPARRVISLYVGAILGLLIASFTHFDLFAASGVLVNGNIIDIGSWQVHWGIVLTGAAMGLGSNPTHELIRAVQEYKNNQKRTPPTS